MPRPKPINPATKQFAIRITGEVDALIDRLVAIDAEEHEEAPNRTAWFVRLVRREARYRRLLPEKGGNLRSTAEQMAPVVEARTSKQHVDE